MFDTVIHRWLRTPYILNVRYLRRVKRPQATLLFLHGIGDNGSMWQNVIALLPEDVSVVTVDLLGFGDSPKPSWGTYNARTQARSLLSTYLKLRITTKVIVVGHSLGSLVAIEFAKRFGLLTHSLILCSPPIYRQNTKANGYSLRPDELLRQAYSYAANDPERLIKLYALAQKVGVGNESLVVNEQNITTFIATLRASIINQHTIDDIAKLNMPIQLLHGIFDPFVVRGNLARLVKKNPNISMHDVAAAHLIRGPYAKKLVKVIDAAIAK